MDLTVVAYATLALSLFVSAVKMGGWILNADPRAIINSGRWALLALAALALGVLAWLVASGRWTSAMMLAAFMLPVFVQARRAGACCLAHSMSRGATFRAAQGISAAQPAASRVRAGRRIRSWCGRRSPC